MNADDTTYHIYYLNDWWSVRPKLIEKDGKQEYEYTFYDDHGDSMFHLSEYDMMVLSRVYKDHNTGGKNDKIL